MRTRTASDKALHPTSLVVAFLIAMVFAAAPLASHAGDMKVPDLEGSSLSIPWSDFKKILEDLKPETPPPEKEEEPPPVDYTITRASLKGSLDAGAAAFDAEIRFTVLREDKWLKIPILPMSLAIEEAMLDGAPPLLETEGGKQLIVLKGAGGHVFTCRFYVPVSNNGGPKKVDVDIIRAPVVTLRFAVPEAGLDIEAKPASLNRVTDKEGATELFSVLKGGQGEGRYNVRWNKKVEAEKAELRINATTETLVTLGEHLCQADVNVIYEILHRPVTSFELKLPPETAVVDVAGQGIADWETEKKDGGRILTVSLDHEAIGNYSLRVIHELAMEDANAEVEVPALETVGTNRETGHIAVAAKTNIEIEVIKAVKLAPIGSAEVPPGLASRSRHDIVHALKYVRTPWELGLRSTRHDDVAVLTSVIERVATRSFLTKEGEVVSHSRFTIRNNRKQFIRLTLPPETSVLSTFRDGLPIKPSRDRDTGEILIPLQQSKPSDLEAKTFTVDIVTLAELGIDMDKWRGKIELPALVADIMAEESLWAVHLPSKREYEAQETDFEPIVPRVGSVSPEGPAGGEKNNQPDSGKDGPADPGWVGDFDKIIQDDPHYRNNRKDFIVSMTNETQGFPEDMDSDKRMNYSILVINDHGGLPVRFEVPESDRSLKFRKTIIQPGEKGSVEIEYKKTLDIDDERRLIMVPSFLTILAGVALLAFLGRRRKNKRQAKAAREDRS